jgi:hypothetical protein
LWIFCKQVIEELAKEKEKTKDLEAKLELHREETNKMVEEVLEWKARFDNEHYTTLRLTNEVEKISKILASRFKMPDFTDLLAPLVPETVDPPNEKPYDAEFLGGQYKVSTHDLSYFAVNKDDWIQILDAVFPLVKKALKTGLAEVADCENFARLTKAFVSIGVYQGGLQKELALAMALSRGHAYNAFMTLDKRVWIWEPQSATLIGEIVDDLPPLSSGETYETLSLRF